LFYLSLDGKLMAVDVARGIAAARASVALFQTPLRPASQTDQYAPSPDGQRFMVIAPRPDAEAAPLNVVINWTSRLKK
jgi:hypothetical protein